MGSPRRSRERPKLATAAAVENLNEIVQHTTRQLSKETEALRMELRELRAFTMRELANPVRGRHDEGPVAGTLGDVAQEIPAGDGRTKSFETQAIRKGASWADPWQHRSMGMRCSTCMFHAPKGFGLNPAEPKGDRILLGRCRRHAPVLGGFPVVVSETDWCGDHKLA
jgi:hypothetical protein